MFGEDGASRMEKKEWKRFLISITAAVILISLSISLQGCERWIISTPKFPEFNETLTHEDGKAVLSTNFGTISALVQDENGVPFPNAIVSSYEFEDGVLVIASREDAAPSFKFVGKGSFSSASILSPSTQEPQLAIVTLVFTLVAVAEIGGVIYDYWKNPGEIPIQIPGLIEGSRKVRSICVQIDANDLLGIGTIVTSGEIVSKAVTVLGAPAIRRGVTAINRGFTKKKLMEYIAKGLRWKVGEEIAKDLGLLDTDLINTCEYVYEDTSGNEYVIPLQKWEVFSASEVVQKILKKFWIYVHNTKVKKGWDWIVRPDGSKIKVPAGKYMLIQEIEQGKKWRVGFEDLTEELGYDYTVDYDYDDPLLEIKLIKVGQLLIKGVHFEGIYRHDLYVNNQVIYENFGDGVYEDFGEWILNFSISIE